MHREVFVWSPGRVRLTVSTEPDHPVTIAGMDLDGVTVATGDCALVEVGVRGLGSAWSSRRYLDSEWTAGSRYLAHRIESTDSAETLVVTSGHVASGLVVDTRLRCTPGGSCLTVDSTVRNTSVEPVTLEWVTSAVLGGIGADRVDSVQIHWADNDWLAEHRWYAAPFRTLVPDLSRSAHQHDGRGCFARSSHGTWSTDGSLPMAAVIDGDGVGIGWQLEHNGGWHWQTGEADGTVYVSLLGPTDRDHQWSFVLGPQEEFDTVPATLALTTSGWTGITDALTARRRATRRPHPVDRELPVVFNDYMNTLMGDPTAARLEPLIDAAAVVGAEVFCIDAGWYADGHEDWWDAVGAWEPAPSRFPAGLGAITDRIRRHNMVPGLWLEPEVVGVRSRIAESLPPEAFFRRGGDRVVEHGRYHLDLRNAQARKHLDSVVDRLVDEFGIGYFKLDYNINPGPGTDHDSGSVGAGLLEHNRAHLGWLDAVRERHPGLILENCASGGMRSDHALLSRMQLQSTSDQQDPVRYPPIAAAAAAAISPEQAASWAYPQPDYSRDLNVSTLLCGMLGRLYLSGRLDAMTTPQIDLVAAAVDTYRDLRGDIARATPFWPLGMPGWDDAWIAHGLRTADRSYVAVWRRGGDTETTRLPLPFRPGSVRLLPPSSEQATLLLTDDRTSVEVLIPSTTGAALFVCS